eukprot:INCI11724.1.p1 GENE.INCI11724.1~~INCI11724.1.p1  ORF type:complete len:340 (-),score=60.00 INCI11724.1:105-1124(-)
MKSGAREDISPPVEAERPPAAAEYAATMLAGASAGCLARTFTYPMDTCKARIMVQKKAAPGTVVVSQALRKEISTIVRKEGFGGFYRGFTFAFFGSIPAGMLYFTFYEFARDTLERHGASSAVTALVGGFFAEALSCVLWVPLDVLKERMQTQTVLAKQLYEGHSDVPNPARSGAPVTYQSSVVFARDIWRSEGFVGLYKGYGATLFSFGPFSALYFLFYEQAKDIGMKIDGVKEEKHLNRPTLVFGASGVAAGAAAAFLTNPLDIVKVRVQVERRGAKVYGYRGMFDGLSKLFAEGNWRGLFRGAGTRMLFQAPTTAIGFATFENFKIFYANLIYNPA